MTLRVLHVQRASGIGGSERHLLMLLPLLAERGLDVHMAVLRTAGGERFAEAMERSGVSTTVLDMAGHFDRSAVTALVDLVRELRADIVHTHLLHADIHGQVAARLVGIAGVSSMHGVPKPYRTMHGWIAAAFAGRLARRTIAISRHVEGFLRTRRLVPSDRIRLVHYGIDAGAWSVPPAVAASTRDTLSASAEDVVVLVASRLIPYKGHDFLLDAFDRAVVRCPQLRLVIAGEGPLRSRLERRILSSPVGDRVVCLGFVDSLPAVMAASDIVAFPTMPGFGEGFGLVNLEAMAAGKPVIGTAVDSIPEIVVDGETGRLVQPGDVSGLAGALCELAESAALRRFLGQAGRVRATEMFHPRRMVEATSAVYAEVAPHQALRG